MLNIIKNTINRVFASGVDSDASAFITATGLSGTTQKSAITTLVKDLKSSGLWSKMKAVYPMVTDNYNLLSYTQDISNAYWGKNNLTYTQNVANPFGSNTAYLLTETATGGYHVMYSGVVATTALSTYSAYLKSNGRQWAWLSDNGGGVYFDLVNGVVGTASGGRTGSITNIGNGWYRCVVSNNAISGGNQYYISLSANGADSGNYTGNGTSGIYVYGNQLEIGSTASTYQLIATTPTAFMASQMKYNLKDARDLDAAFRLTWSGGWTYSATGATPNGTNAYADSKLIPSANLSTNNTHISSYIRNTSQGVLLGTDNAFRLWIAPNFNGTNRYAEINNGATTTPTTPISTLIGLWSGSRINSSAVKLYNNSSINYSYNILSSGLDTSAIYISARNAGGASNYSSSQVAFSSIGDGLTDQDTFLLNQIVEKYQVALSRGVQAAQSFYYNSDYSNEANTYLYSTQITGTTQVSAINTLINGLKANNLWAKMKAVYPFVTDKTLQADMAAQMKFNLVNPQDSDAAFRLAFSGGWTYSTNGAQPNGTNGYADTKLIPNTNLVLNNVSFSVYSRNNFTPITDQSLGCGIGGQNIPLLAQSFTSTKLINTYIYSYNTPDIMITSSGLNFSGLFISTRTAANNAKVFKNNTQLASSTTQSQAAQPTNNFFFGAFNGGIGVVNYSNFEYAFAHIGTGLSDAEVAILTQLVTDYQTTLSRQV